MNRKSVVSSNLRSVGYDPITFTLEIEFNSGSIYQYSKVPYEIYKGLMNAPSKGEYHSANIKYSFQYRQIV